MRVARKLRSGWFSGFVVGMAAGFATLEIPFLGWALVVAFGVVAAIRGPRLAGIGGLLTGLGTIWVVLLGRVALECRATGDELGCHAPGIEAWLAVGFGMLAGGVLVTAMAWWWHRR